MTTTEAIETIDQLRNSLALDYRTEPNESSKARVLSQIQALTEARNALCKLLPHGG